MFTDYGNSGELSSRMMTRRAHVYALCMVVLIVGTPAVKLRGHDNGVELHQETAVEDSKADGLELLKGPETGHADDDHKEGLTVEASGKSLLTVSASDEPPAGSEVSDGTEQVGMVLDADVDVEKCKDIRLEKACRGNGECQWANDRCVVKGIGADVNPTVDDVGVTEDDLLHVKGKLATLQKEGKGGTPAARSLEDQAVEESKDIKSNVHSEKRELNAELERAREDVSRAQTKVKDARAELDRLQKEYDEKNAECNKVMVGNENFKEECHRLGCITKHQSDGEDKCQADDGELNDAKRALEVAHREEADATVLVSTLESDLSQLSAANKEAGGETAKEAQDDKAKDRAAKEAVRVEETQERTDVCNGLTEHECNDKSDVCKYDNGACLPLPVKRGRDPANEVAEKAEARYQELSKTCVQFKAQEDQCRKAGCVFDGDACSAPSKEEIEAKMAEEAEEEMKKKCAGVKEDNVDDWNEKCAAALGCKVDGDECVAEKITPGASVAEEAQDGLDEGTIDDMDENERKCATCEAAFSEIRKAGLHFDKDINLLAYNDKVLVDADSICKPDHFLVLKENGLAKIFKSKETCKKSVGDLLDNATFGKFVSFGCSGEGECEGSKVCSNANIGFCSGSERNVEPKNGSFEHTKWSNVFHSLASASLSAAASSAHRASGTKESFEAAEHELDELKAAAKKAESRVRDYEKAVEREKHEEITEQDDTDVHAKKLVFLKDRLKMLSEKSKDDNVSKLLDAEKASWSERWEAIINSVKDDGIRGRLLTPINKDDWPSKIQHGAAGASALGIESEGGLRTQKSVSVEVPEGKDSAGADAEKKGGEETKTRSLGVVEDASIADASLKSQSSKSAEKGGGGLSSGGATDPAAAKASEEEATEEANACGRIAEPKEEVCHQKKCGYDEKTNKCVAPPSQETCQSKFSNDMAGCKNAHCVWFDMTTEFECISPLKLPVAEHERETNIEKLEAVEEELDKEGGAETTDGEASSDKKASGGDKEASGGEKSNGGKKASGEGAESAGKAPSADDIVRGMKDHKEVERDELVKAIVKELDDKQLRDTVELHLGTPGARAQAIVNIMMGDPKVREGVSKKMKWTREEIEEVAENAEKDSSKAELVGKTTTPPNPPTQKSN